MDFLKIFSREAPASPVPLPSGTLTLDRSGRIVTSTLPKFFPEKLGLEIGRVVIDTFRQAQGAEVVLTEIIINFSSLKLTARELRGGAIIFFAPNSGASAAANKP